MLWFQAVLQVFSSRKWFLHCEVEMLPGEWERGQSSNETVKEVSEARNVLS